MNIEDYIKRYNENIKKAKTARTHRDFYIREAIKIADQFSGYVGYYKASKKVPKHYKFYLKKYQKKVFLRLMV